VNHFARLVLTLLPTLGCLPLSTFAATEITIMSFNTWGAGRNEGLPIDRTLAAIRAVDPDIIGLQEIRPEASHCSTADCPPGDDSVAPDLARALGYELLEQLTDNEVLWANAILSRHPIMDRTPGGLGARIAVDGREILLFNIHAPDYPYQPYQLLGIPYGEAPFLETAEQAEDAARIARSNASRLLLQDIATAGRAELVAITGDFNEPSHRDWTPAAVEAGLHPLAVNWPFTRALEAAGFTDAFRAAHPDEVARPGFTWSPLIGP
jgi:exodeoxyribonuclease III